MSLGITNETMSAYAPVFQKILEKIPSGGTLKTDRVPSDDKIIRAGTLLAESSSTSGLFNIVKTGVPLASVTATGVTLFVNSANLFKASEFIMKAGGDTASTITAISRSGSTDTIIVGTSIGTLTTNSVLYECAAAETSDTSSEYTATAILGDTVTVRRGDLSTIPNVLVNPVVRGTVDESRLPTPVKPADKTALTDRIRFA